jgi:hypothetical protein
MIREILIGIKQTAAQQDPERFFGHQHKSNFQVMAVTTEPSDWAPVFESARKTFDTIRQKTHLLATSDPAWKTIQQLVQWHQLDRVQMAAQPTLLRMPVHIPHTHRGWALLYNDNTVEIVEEDLAEVRHPRAKFRKPVNIGIFFFGHAQPPVQQPPSSQPSSVQPPLEPREDDPQVIVASNVQGITFPKMPGLPRDVKTALARLHRNLGHPHANELKKMIAMNGIKDQKIYDAIEGLHCDSCVRVKGPGRPEPSGVPHDVNWQFGDILQIDIFNTRDIRAANYIFLGIIDECTHLHMALRLNDRSPEEVTHQFTTFWARAFGFPLKIKADPDGSFRGSFESSMDEAGVYMDYIPAEAHHRIGLIERHNATLRELMERTIDSRAVVGDYDMEQAAVAACFAKNSTTWSSGRPPFIAAFGRIPRMGMNLLSDKHALVAGRTREQAQREADYLRVEAQQHLAAMSVDSSLRRALLRKSTTTGPQELPVGSIAAYWRWTMRSGKKRGGFKLARVLGRDPDGKSIWLQAGTNTIKAAEHQIRAAVGIEQWCPSPEDVKSLRSAVDNMQHGILADETLPEHADQQLPGFEEVQPAVQVPPPLHEEPEMFEEAGAHLIPVPSTPRPAASTPHLPDLQAEEAVQTDPYPETNIHMNVSSPTYRQTIIQNQTFGMNEQQQAQPSVNVPVRKPHRARSKTPARRTLQDQLGERHRAARQLPLTDGPVSERQHGPPSVQQPLGPFPVQSHEPDSVQQSVGKPLLAQPNARSTGDETPPLQGLPTSRRCDCSFG